MTFSELAAHSRGLVALSGCLGGFAPQAICQHGEGAGAKALGELTEIFDPGSVFVELQEHGLPEQSVLNGLLSQAAKNLGLPVVATNNVQFVNREDGDAQLYLECVRLNRRYEDAKKYHHGRFEMYLEVAERDGAGVRVTTPTP